jgi:hypothetical protein
MGGKMDSQNPLIVYAVLAVAMLAIGFGLGMTYMGMTAKPVQQNVTQNVTLSGSACTQQNATVADAPARIEKIRGALERVLALQGSPTNVSFTNSVGNGEYITLNFKSADGQALSPIQVSNDYTYVYQGEPTPIDDLLSQIAAAEAQNSQPTTPAANLTKSDKPNVELFVMSYCPYGTQMEKALLPAQQLLASKANISIKFVSYTMHGAKETQENTRQYCIKSQYPDKFWNYLSCFLEDGNATRCMANLSINSAMIDACMSTTYSQYSLSDSSTAYPIHQAENALYGVQGSPTLVINGVESSASRSPEGVKAAICNAFTTAPAECNTALSTTQESAGFGYSGTATGSSGSCG